jgi:O-succinylbenzoate synthase
MNKIIKNADFKVEKVRAVKKVEAKPTIKPVIKKVEVK